MGHDLLMSQVAHVKVDLDGQRHRFGWPREVDMASCDILEPEDLQDGLIVACQARPVSADVHIEF